MIDIEQVISKHIPKLTQKPRLKSKISSILAELFHSTEINQFIAENKELAYPDFLDKTNQHLGLSYKVSQQSIENIPSRGRLVVIANHPLGSLDGLALLSLIRSVRPDVKIVVNELLWSIGPLRPFFLTVNNMGGGNSKEKLKQIQNVITDEQAVIFFPAGEVSRLTSRGIRDAK